MFGTIYNLFVKYLYPDVDCTGKTIIVTGANIGLGKEAVRHFVRLNASKVILAVRSIAKGNAAQAEIEATTHRTDVTEVWELDLSSYGSVKAFAARAAGLPRVDAVVANASIATMKFEVAEENESTITVNVVSTMLLVLLLLPTMSASASKWGIVPVITVVTSNIHSWVSFPEWKTSNSLATLSDKEIAVMRDRLVPPPFSTRDHSKQGGLTFLCMKLSCLQTSTSSRSPRTIRQDREEKAQSGSQYAQPWPVQDGTDAQRNGNDQDRDGGSKGFTSANCRGGESSARPCCNFRTRFPRAVHK